MQWHLRAGALAVLALACVECTFDVTVVQGSHFVPDETNTIVTSDYQTWCLKMSSATSDVLLECTLSGPLHDEYSSHCQYAEATQKMQRCCRFCCSPLSNEEMKGWATNFTRRCYQNDVYCTDDTIQEQCGEALNYCADLQAADNFVTAIWPRDVEDRT